MRSSKPWLVVVGFLLVFAFSASSALATGYLRGYVRPSGDGADCATVTPGTNCVSDSGSTLFANPGGLTTPNVYSLFQVGVTPGATVDFTFFGGIPDNTLSSSFGVLACAYEFSGNPASPGIYTSNSSTPISTNCTQLGDYQSSPSAFIDASTFITDLTGTTDCPTPNTVCYKFSGSGLPFSWVFSELSSGPQLLSITETFQPASVPEPASITLLAAGLFGLGIFRRKRTV